MSQFANEFAFEMGDDGSCHMTFRNSYDNTVISDMVVPVVVSKQIAFALLRGIRAHEEATGNSIPMTQKIKDWAESIGIAPEDW
jgi:hypothetical protein